MNPGIFDIITGAAFEVYNEYHGGLVESAYEAALRFVLEQKGIEVQRQVFLPIYYKGTKLEQNYRIDLLVNNNIIVELKAIKFVTDAERRQLHHYMHLTQLPYGMLINFSSKSVFSERWKYNSDTHFCERF